MKWDCLRIDYNTYWKMIEEIGWEKHERFYRGGYKTETEELLKKYPKELVLVLGEFARNQRMRLKEVLNQYSINKIGSLDYYGLGDDSFWDLTAHIVGLGHKKYYQVLNDPEIARTMARNADFVENFEYIFSPHTIEETLKIINNEAK